MAIKVKVPDFIPDDSAAKEIQADVDKGDAENEDESNQEDQKVEEEKNQEEAQQDEAQQDSGALADDIEKLREEFV